MLFKSIVATALFAASAAAAPVEDKRAYYGININVKEAWVCINPFNVAACLAAQTHADVASSQAAKRFASSSLHNGKGDAYRHCYWNARMTIDFGADKAKTIATAHEEGSDGPAAEKKMDLANNATGRSIGGSASGSSKSAKYTSAEATCRSRANGGQLKTLK
jgi:hypothetical protein